MASITLLSLVLLNSLFLISSIENPIFIDGDVSGPKLYSHCNFAPDVTPNPGLENFRKFTFTSHCNQDLYVNMQGYTWYANMQPQYQSLPEGGGFKLPAMSSKAYSVSERVYSGRIWARINCENRTGILLGNAGKFICDTANCPLPYGTPVGATNPDVTCTIYTQSGTGIFVGGVPPGALAEFTLCGGFGANPQCYSGANNCPAGPDYYDMSLVDGPAGLTISMTQINGQAAGTDPAFSCGAPYVNKFDYKSCPLELRVGLKYDPQTTIWSYYNKAALADTLGCISGCQYIANYYPNTDPNYNNLYAKTCCTCGMNGGTCEQYCGGDGCQTGESNPQCIAGCSPYAGYPNDGGWNATKCYLSNMPSIDTGRSCSQASNCYDGPSSTNPYSCNSGRCYLNLGKVPNIFKTSSPLAYSWQFDDLSSTYMCYFPDYLVEFSC
eukprot:TRINITY_DN1028_c0_g1_i1.p1 TRINITY_DN1028_c0_g1~~TRINITY_DN1028_c0_g1_i1.p1  ORF type:complete len:450 (-),score=84.00 TRINITY_DN1028_c0_g1_i1:194-1510(-)